MSSAIGLCLTCVGLAPPPLLTNAASAAAAALDQLATLLPPPPPPPPSTIFQGQIDEAYMALNAVREGGNALEGVHSDTSQPLTQRVLDAVPELSSWANWYSHPRYCANGHLHTILAAKLRKTRAVRYHRVLVPTPDGGTLAVDLLAGLRVAEHSNDAKPDPSSLLTGGARPGAAEEEGFTQFVDTPPPLDPSRPLLLLASGLGGGSQDTYVRSMAGTAAERGWQVAVLNMRACGSSPVTSPQLFSAYRGANDDVRTTVKYLRETRLGGGGIVAALGWSNSGTIVNNVLAEQSTTHGEDPLMAIDAACSLCTPLNMPANSENLQRPFHNQVYDRNLGVSLQKLWAAAREQYADPITGGMVPVPRWDDPAITFVADDELAKTARTIRELDEAVTRRQYGYASVDDYYAAASSDQRLKDIGTPTLLLNAFDDPIVPGGSLRRAIDAARANPQIVLALTSHGGHLGWCEQGDPWGGPTWTERVSCGFLEAALDLDKAEACETVGCELFD